MANHVVEVKQAFQTVTELGPLQMIDLGKALNSQNPMDAVKTLDGPRTITRDYKEGERIVFRNKKDVQAYVKHYGVKVEYVGVQTKK